MTDLRVTEDRFPGQVLAFRSTAEAEMSLPRPRESMASRIKVSWLYMLRHSIHRAINFKEGKKCAKP